MEKWKGIKGFEEYYEVSDRGRVRGLRNNKILKPSPDIYGYYFVTLYGNGERRVWKAHRLVAAAFIGDVESLVVHHVNGDRRDNRVSNLEIVTRAQNVQYAAAAGCFVHTGELNPNSKLTARDVTEIRHRYKARSKTRNQRALAKEYGVSQNAISRIVNRQSWRTIDG